MRPFLLSAFALFLFSAPAFALPEIGKPAPNFQIKDAANRDVSLAGYKGKIVVLEWNNPGCPFVKKFYGVGAMQKLQSELKARNVVWISINSGGPGKEGRLNNDEAIQFVADSKSNADHYILDSDGKIGMAYGARTTPHMFVIDKDGNLAYMGAIDDRPTAESADIVKAKNYVRAAIEALDSGAKIEVASTQAYGCSVKY